MHKVVLDGADEMTNDDSLPLFIGNFLMTDVVGAIAATLLTLLVIRHVNVDKSIGAVYDTIRYEMLF